MPDFTLNVQGFEPFVGSIDDELSIPVPNYRFAWDDEISDYNFKSRTQSEGYRGPKSPPAVLRYFPVMKEDAGDFRVDVSNWKNFFIHLNNDFTGQDFEYWTRSDKSQFNQTGWPQFAYLGMSGNLLVGEKVIGNRGSEWLKFITLKVNDLELATSQKMTRASHPHFIHTFTCVGYRNNQTVRIQSTNTARGIIDYPMITKEGHAYIPIRHVKKL